MQKVVVNANGSTAVFARSKSMKNGPFGRPSYDGCIILLALDWQKVLCSEVAAPLNGTIVIIVERAE